MLEDGLALGGLFLGRKPQRPAGRGQVLLALVDKVVDDSRRDRRGDTAQSQAHEHGKGIVIGMNVVGRWGNQLNVGRQALQAALTSSARNPAPACMSAGVVP